jgi:hypothetical protein
MPKCEHCGVEVEFPFQCNYCGKYFCEAHRLLENHNCPNAPPRTPLGSYQTKQMLADNTKKREIETASQNVSVGYWKTETPTYGNIFGHRFNVPIEVYSDKKYRDKLNKAKTLSEVEHILRDYRKHHKTNKDDPI